MLKTANSCVGALLFLLTVITYLDRVCISVAGPRVQEYLRIGPQQWGWVVGVFAFGACANVGSGITSDFLLNRFGVKAARQRVGIIGLASGGLFSLLIALTPSKVGALPLLCLRFAGMSFNQSMTFPICIDVARKFPGSMGGAINVAAQVVPFFRVSYSAISQRSPAAMTGR